MVPLDELVGGQTPNPLIIRGGTLNIGTSMKCSNFAHGKHEKRMMTTAVFASSSFSVAQRRCSAMPMRME